MLNSKYERDLTTKNGKPVKKITLAPNADGQYISRKNPKKSRSKSPMRKRSTFIDDDPRTSVSTSNDRYIDMLRDRQERNYSYMLESPKSKRSSSVMQGSEFKKFGNVAMAASKMKKKKKKKGSAKKKAV